MASIRSAGQRQERFTKKTGNLRVVQTRLGHTKVDRTVRDLGVELEEALNMAERIDI